MIYDVVIVGAGPSGSTLARLLGKDYRVLVVEKRPLEGGEIQKEKCCGGLLAPDAQKMLAKLGLGLPKEILSSPQLFSVCAIDFDNRMERHYQRHYINMDREKFDSWLISLIPDNVETLFGASLKNIKKRDNHYLVEVKSGQGLKKYGAKVVVGADGAYSKVRRVMFPGMDEPKKYMAVQEWFPVNDNPKPCYYSIFDSDITDFYSWMIQKENYLILGSAMDPEDDVKGNFELLKRRVSDYGIDLSAPAKKNGTFLLRPEKLSQLNQGADGIALIGEAAGWISPSSAEGLSYSMESAYILSESIKKSLNNFMFHYVRSTRKIRRNIAMKNMKSHLMYNRFTRKMIMASGILSL